MTALDPGARLVLTQGLTERPLATAFLASKPAPMSTDGLEVFVHDVMAAVTTRPWPSLKSSPFEDSSTSVPAGAGKLPFLSFSLRSTSTAALQASLISARGTRSCGRLGPASEGST